MSQEPVFDKISKYETDIKARKAKAQEVRDIRIKGEAKLEQLEKSEAELIAKIKAAGLDPDKLPQYILDRQVEMDKALALLDAALPDDNGTVHLDKIFPQKVDAVLEVEVPSAEFSVPDDIEIPVQTSTTDPLDSLFDDMPPPTKRP